MKKKNPVMPSSRGSSPAGNSAGFPGSSKAAVAIPGPTSPGAPASMKKALKKKSTKDKGWAFPGSR